jgi:hypothetical protein
MRVRVRLGVGRWHPCSQIRRHVPPCFDHGQQPGGPIPEPTMPVPAQAVEGFPSCSDDVFDDHLFYYFFSIHLMDKLSIALFNFKWLGIWWKSLPTSQLQLAYSCLVLPCLGLCCVVVSCFVLCCVVLWCVLVYCIIFYLAWRCVVLSFPVLSCLVLSCLVLPCLVLTCLALSCLVLPCLVFVPCLRHYGLSMHHK